MPDSRSERATGRLEVRELSKRFDGPQVLDRITLSVQAGEFVTLLGPSGCGKTTLLRIIAGLEIADTGEVLLDGRSMTALPANRRPVNTVFQNYALFPHLDVYENVAFGLRARKVPRAETAERVQRALRLLRMEEFARRSPHQLSGGQKQRVALARALVNEPQVLLLDEPMSALDAKLRGELQLELRRLQRQLGRTFILVTHDQDEAMTVSDRILVMRDGRIEQSGTPAEVYERPLSRFVAEFLGSANLIAATASAEQAAETPLGPLRLSERPPWASGQLAIRPEHIRLTAEPAGVNSLPAVIREVVYRGDHAEVFIEPGSLRVRASAHAGLCAGQSLHAQLPPEHLVILHEPTPGLVG